MKLAGGILDMSQSIVSLVRFKVKQTAKLFRDKVEADRKRSDDNPHADR